MEFPNSLLYSGVRGRRAGMSGMGDISLPDIVGPQTTTTQAPASGGFDWAGVLKTAVGSAVEAGKAYLSYDVQKTQAEVIKKQLETNAAGTTGVLNYPYLFNPQYVPPGSNVLGGIPVWVPIVAVGLVVGLVVMRK